MAIETTDQEGIHIFAFQLRFHTGNHAEEYKKKNEPMKQT